MYNRYAHSATLGTKRNPVLSSLSLGELNKASLLCSLPRSTSGALNPGRGLTEGPQGRVDKNMLYKLKTFLALGRCMEEGITKISSVFQMCSE